MYWKRPYDPEEQEARFICGDPIAVAWGKLEVWLKEQDFRYPILIEEAVECLWQQKFGNSMTKFEIMRNTKYFPECMPDDFYDFVIKNLFEGG